MLEHSRIAGLVNRSWSHTREDSQGQGDEDVATPKPTRCALAQSLLALGGSTLRRVAIERSRHARLRVLGLDF
jgi:hypothetical protein